jgi:hypothetical protein
VNVNKWIETQMMRKKRRKNMKISLKKENSTTMRKMLSELLYTKN